MRDRPEDEPGTEGAAGAWVSGPPRPRLVPVHTRLRDSASGEFGDARIAPLRAPELGPIANFQSMAARASA